MDYTPFAAEQQLVESRIAELGLRRDALMEQVDWTSNFNLDQALREISRLNAELEGREAELIRLMADISELEADARSLTAQTSSLESKARLGFNPFRLFTNEYITAKAHFLSHQQQIARLSGRMGRLMSDRDQVTYRATHLTGLVSDKEHILIRFRSFRSVEVEGEITTIMEELPVLERKRIDLEVRAASVDLKIEAPLAELRRYESEIKVHESEIASLKSKQSTMASQIKEAENINKKLSTAPNKYEKAMLHEESEQRLGNRSPRDAIRGIRSQLSSFSNEIQTHQRQVARVRRDLSKTEQRVITLARVASQDVEALIIDGNNCCYEGSKFIGLAALLPMTEELTKRFDTTVVFDASIRSLLHMSDDAIRFALPAADVHVVATRIKADETILDAASEPTIWIISNDRFGDYRDKFAVKQGRLIRHEVLRGRVLVHDLGVNELFQERSKA